MASIKKYYDRKRAGLCTICGSVPPSAGLTKCDSCREAENKKCAAWYRANKEKQRVANCDRYAELRSAAYIALGNQCACCGQNEEDFFSIDHIGGWGQEHRAAGATSGIKVYRAVLRNTSGFQILCFNCHMCISLRGFCPHKPNSTDPRFISKKLRWLKN